MSATSDKPATDQSATDPAGHLNSGLRMLIPRAGGRVIARFTTVLMILVVATPSEVYLLAIALAVTWIAIAVGWEGCINLPGFLGRVAGQVREHLQRVTADWLTVAAYLIIGLLWSFLSPRPDWLKAAPVVLTAFAYWTAQFAALPPGAMGRWFHFQWQLIRESFGRPQGALAEPKDESKPASQDGPAPAPINPFEATLWPSQQQERFDDWLAEEVRRFESEEGTPSDHRHRSLVDDNPESTQQLSSLKLGDDAAPDNEDQQSSTRHS